MNNANCYALEAKAKYIYDSGSQQQQYQFHETNIIRTQKSMSLASVKNMKSAKQNDMKKSNSFLLSNKKQTQPTKVTIDQKQKSKTSKKCLNITQIRKKPPINSKNSMNKTSVSIGSVSGKSIKTTKKKNTNKDYLILDSQIYQCQNIEEINQKLICGNTQIYSHQRFIKATLKNQDKLQNYLISFKQHINYMKKNRKRNNLNINQMSEQQKKKLYILLRKQTKTETHIQKQKKKQQNSYQMQNFIKQAYYKIQQQTNQKINQNPTEQNEIRQWKNKRLHQLLQIQSCLKQCDQDKDLQQQKSFRYKKRRELGQTSFDQQTFIEKNIHKPSQKTQQNIQTKATLSTISIKNIQNSSKNQKYQEKYPEHKNINSSINHQIVKYLPDDHYISRFGIQRFLHNLWDFLVDSDLISQFIHNLRNPYGFSLKDKYHIMKQSETDFNQYLSLISLKNKSILQNQVFIKFCKSNQQTIAYLNEQQQKSIIIFQKSVFDTLNLYLTKYQIDFPFGSYHYMQNNYNGSGYLINQQNAMMVWDQCIQSLVNSNQIGMGPLIQFQNQQMEQITKKHYEKCFKQLIKQDIQFFNWEKTKPLTNRKIFQILIQQIQKQLIKQSIKEITQI